MCVYVNINIYIYIYYMHVVVCCSRDYFYVVVHRSRLYCKVCLVCACSPPNGRHQAPRCELDAYMCSRVHHKNFILMFDSRSGNPKP